jgi:toxin FitB
MTSITLAEIRFGIASAREQAGAPVAGFDALIAAVCRSHRAALAARNLPYSDDTGVEIINPWTSTSG